MRSEKGNKLAKGGRRNPPGGTKDQRQPALASSPPASSPPASSPPPAPEYELLFATISNPKKRAFLAAFATCGHVVDAAAGAGISWTSHYNWLKEEDNVAYTEAFNRAREIAGDIAEGEVYRRAILGFDHPVIYEGKITTTYKDYSDTLAMFWLKGLKPERYRENLNLSGSVGLPVDDFYNRIAERKREEKKS